MALEEIIKTLCAADKQTLARVSRVLTHTDGEEVARPELEMRLITQREAARRLGVSTTTIWRLVKEGSLIAVDVRGKRRIRLDSLRVYSVGREVVA